MSSMQRPNHALTEGAIGKTLLLFSLCRSWPATCCNRSNGSVNAIWVGHGLGEAALAATSNANTILFFLLGAVFGVGMAATILVGQSIGAKNLDQAKRVIGTSLVFFVGISVADRRIRAAVRRAHDGAGCTRRPTRSRSRWPTCASSFSACRSCTCCRSSA